MKRPVGAAAALWLVLAPLVATAQAARDPVAAEALFAEAKALTQEGRWAEACPKLGESYRLDPTPGTLLNLADCEERVGRVATAWGHWKEAAARLPAGDERAGLVAQRIAALEPRLPRLAIRAASLPPGAEVLRDGVTLQGPSLGVALPVDPGAHEIVVRAPEHDEARFSVTLAEAETQALEVGPGPRRPAPPATASAAPPRAAAEDPGGPSAVQTAGIVVLGVGGLSLVGAAVTGAMVLSAADEVDAGCPEARCTTTEGFDAAERGQTLLVVNAILWGAGLLGVGAGTAMIVLGGDDGAAVGVGGLAGPATAGVALHGILP